MLSVKVGESHKALHTIAPSPSSAAPQSTISARATPAPAAIRTNTAAIVDFIKAIVTAQLHAIHHSPPPRIYYSRLLRLRAPASTLATLSKLHPRVNSKFNLANAPMLQCSIMLHQCSIHSTSRSRVLVLHEVYSIKASFDVTPGKESELGGHTAFGGTVRLCDEDGDVSQPNCLGSAAIRAGHAAFSTTVNALTADGKKLGRLSRLQWDIPSQVREIAVPIEFKNINARSESTRRR